VALGTTFIIAVGAATMRYTTVIKEMNTLFSGQVMVVSKDTIVIQVIPIGGGMLPQNRTERLIQNITGVDKTIPILFVTSVDISGMLQPVPVNFSIGIPVKEWWSVLGPTSLGGNIGHFPTNESSMEIVVGASLADQYNWTVGKRIVINNHRLNITGILDSKLALLSRCIIIPLKLAQEIYYSKSESVNIILAKPTQGYSQEELADSIEHKVDYVKALTEDERNDIIRPILLQVKMWNLGIQTIIFILSLILVMTVTIMSVSERRRDFATLEAVGAPLSYVFKVVLFETSLIGVFGGIIGIIFGSIGALLLAAVYTNIPITQFIPGIFEFVPPFYILQIFVADIAVCCLGGIIPAINATRIRVAEVLRAEY